jgi:hypothetical protein
MRDQIMQAIEAHLGTIDRPAGVPAPVRTRLESLEPSQLPAITLFQGQEIVDPTRDEKPRRTSRGAVIRRALDVKFESVTKHVPGAATVCDADADALIVWVTNAMSSIGRVVTAAYPRGICHDPPDEVGTVFEYEQAKYPLCRATTIFRFHYHTSITNVESKS